MSSTGMPQKLQGIIFTEIIPKLIPEVDTRSLVRLGSIVRKMNRTKVYEPLTDALRKIQWIKLTAIEALSVEGDIANAMEPGAIVSYPFGQIRHSLAVTDALIHTKPALDSIAVFLADLLRLEAKGANRDFKKPEFREEIYSNDLTLGTRLKTLEPWFRELQEIRDEWIHRSSIRNMLIVGPSECGPLPIPRRDLDKGLRAFDRPITRKHFFSTKEFLEHHYNNLIAMFRAVVERSIEIELISVTEPSVDLEVERSLGVFPLKSTESMNLAKIKVKIGPLGF
jgi:hypothetical protein